jgi:hypothetical protein
VLVMCTVRRRRKDMRGWLWDETSVETTRSRDPRWTRRDSLGGSVEPDYDLDAFVPDVDCEGRLPNAPDHSNQ